MEKEEINQNVVIIAQYANFLIQRKKLAFLTPHSPDLFLFFDFYLFLLFSDF